jgi:imidazolonepropionase
MTLAITNAAQLVCVAQSGERVKTGAALRQPEIIPNGAVVVQHGHIEWVGPTAQLPHLPPGAQVLDATGKAVLPGLIDSHTHLVYAGERADEFEQRLQGATYQEIAARGGGIRATVQSVRQASREQLSGLTRRRLRRMLGFGVTTVEIKSGYGLSLADEVKCLEAAAELDEEGPVEVVATFLGAHAVPPEFQDDRAGYVRLLVEEMLPEVAHCKLAECCDVFCDEGAFTLHEAEQILTRARGLGLGLKLHADELSPSGGARLAARLGALSADHLLQIDEAGIEALARSSTVATLLPGTAFFLGLPYAPARRLIERGLAVALASDCNPGTCPSENLPLAGTLACTQMKVLPAEALTALTLNAAAALGHANRLGSIEPGKQADLVILDAADYRQMFYHFGVSHVWRVLKRGRVVYEA